MEDEVRTWALPYLEEIANSGTPFGGDYNQFITAFNKCFALMDSAEAVQDALKSLKQGKDSVAEYQAKFDQFTNQTSWSDADHWTRFYDGLSETIKDNLAISDRPIGTLMELRQAAQILDQRMRQRQAEKLGKSLHNTPHTTSSKAPDAMDVDASSQQQQPAKEKHTRYTYLSWMKGKCFGCGSTDHAKKDGKHEHDVCRHCKKVGHRSPVCMAKYLGKPIAAKAATTDQKAASSSTTDAKGKASVSTTTPAPAQNSKAQADLLAKLMAQMQEQSTQIEALKSSF